MINIGSHVPMRGKKMYLGSVEQTLEYKGEAFMVYTGAPQNTRRRPIEEMNIEEASKLMEDNNLSFDNVIIHAPYIMNFANPSKEKRDFAIRFLTTEIERSQAMKAKQIVLHPGNAVGKDRPQAIKWIAEGVNKVIANTKGSDVKIALETMAGKGTEVGKTFEELAEIIELIEDKSRVSVCFDTCHVHDGGYDIKNDFQGVIDEFDKIVGNEYISVFHINDSKNELGAAKDRHENIGFGHIGFDALLEVIYHEDFLEIPKILETPFVEDKAPYKHELEMIRNKKFDKNLKEKIANE